MHQAVARNVAAASAFDHREIIRPELHLCRIEFLRRNSFLLNLSNHGVELRDRLLRRVLGFVHYSCDHLCRAVVIEQISAGIVNAAFGVHRNLFLEHERAIDAPYTASVEGLIEHCHRVPVRCAALGRVVADGQRRQRAEFLCYHATPLFGLLRLGGIGKRRRGAGRDILEILAGEFEALLGLDVTQN